MQHFRIIQIANAIATLVFFVLGIVLVLSFYFNLSLVDELQEASNFDNWKGFIITAGIFSLLVAVVFGAGFWITFQMYGGGNNSVVAETIYILGIGMELARPATLGSDSSIAASSSSIASIFGFGYDDEFKWTYAGRKPMPRQDPNEEEDTVEDMEMEKQKNKTPESELAVNGNAAKNE